ncbi:MAG: isocitrate lyase/phosphoenolpyruvate mutase family protein [Antricoccus sp.]
MTDSRAAEFLALHHTGSPLLLANAWDIGTAKAFAHLGFQAIATTSSGFAAALGRHDSNVTADEAIDHAAQLAAGVDIPVNADLEDGFAQDSAEVVRLYRRAADAGIAGASIEDWDPVTGKIYPISQALERVQAAVEAAHSGALRMVITARAENVLRAVGDLDMAIERLLAYQAVGADVLYAPAVISAADIAELVAAVDLPVNVLALPGTPPVAQLAALGVARVSVGGGFSLVSYGAVARAAQELLTDGTYGWWSVAGAAEAVRGAFDA